MRRFIHGTPIGFPSARRVFDCGLCRLPVHLKHNLNAQAVGALKQEIGSIKAEVDDLIAEIRKSIGEADDFIKNFE